MAHAQLIEYLERLFMPQGFFDDVHFVRGHLLVWRPHTETRLRPLLIHFLPLLRSLNRNKIKIYETFIDYITNLYI